MMVNMKNNELTKKELREVSRRWIFTNQICWNYQTMMGPGYLYSMLPLIYKLYPNKEERLEMLEIHSKFFNTNPVFGHIIVATGAATEVVQGSDAKEAVAGLKTGLMGPLAGVGDSITGVLIPTIFGSIAAYLALEGNPAGVLLWIAVNIGILLFRYFSFEVAFKQGTKLVTNIAEKMNQVTAGATVLGLTVVGGLIPTVVKANCVTVFQTGDVTLTLQSVFDTILPSLLPVVLVGVLYYLLGKKKMTPNILIMGVMVLGVALSYIGFLG
ncbi:PTS system mannose/fructose/sorbose family transporter subunit IID [Tannockella kyphosi]|uniref:PTS system mannose/fructose/sorbose family transporter subunit IID n=1 Tax=Tannockella kyphosi TaxID=2899121 RepID=UPI0020137C32|nr:PTS system mannose/fructose/sorbose family transporter subunit IID [Tannockella kyphosi]